MDITTLFSVRSSLSFSYSMLTDCSLGQQFTESGALKFPAFCNLHLRIPRLEPVNKLKVWKILDQYEKGTSTLVLHFKKVPVG